MILAVLLQAAVSVAAPDAGGEAAPTNAAAKIEHPVRITSDSTYFDRKEGIAALRGHVQVVDDKYQLNADRAYLYLEGTNTLKSIVAMGSVAMTNGTKRAYGDKLTYFHGRKLVVLAGSPQTPAKVLEEQSEGDRVLTGRKIRFWIDADQVEVVESEISTPAKGAGGGMSILNINAK